MADFTIVNAGEKLVVGQVDTSFLTAGNKLLPGTTVLNGPVFVGATPQIGVARATCMIGPPLGISVPASLEVTGISNLLGVTNQLGLFNCTGIAFKSAVDISNGIKLNNGLASNVGLNSKVGGTVTGEPAHDVNCSGPIKLSSLSIVVLSAPSINLYGLTFINGISFATVATKALAAKAFDIPHPTKPDTHRLRYICLEGPEPGVYLRGKLIDNNIIELPDYWTEEFIYVESITVNLTAVGHYQELFVEKIDNLKVKIKNNSSSLINCYYTIFAERKTKDKLQSVYEGKTPADYPGDNSEYSLAGWNYDRRF